MATLSSLLGSSFQGNSGVIAIANTVVVTPDTDPSVADLTTSNTGLLTAQFSLPRAPDISVGTTTITNPNSNPSLSNSGTNGDAVLDFTLPRAANVSLGSVSTVNPNVSPSITNVGTNGDVTLDIDIPRAANVSLGTVSTVNPNASPSITDVGTNGDVTLDIDIPRAANVTISSVSLGSNTTNAAVTNSGANGDVALNFTIPKGGDVALGTVSVANPNANPAISDVGTNGDSVFNFSLPRAANVSIGTVSTGAAGSSAAVTNSGSNGDVVLNFTIPKGDTGVGDVDGPASATDNAIVRFDGTTGKLVQNSSVTINDSGTVTATTFSGALSGNATTATTLQTARNIALTGAVTGNANFDGSGNISISTTATADPTLTINGDASGSATFTNLGNATLTLTIADDSHNHTISNVDGLQTALDAKLASSSYTASDVLTKIKTVDGSGSGLDADTLDGAQPSVSASNSTIVQRHPSGYIFANYFNTTANDVSSGVTRVMVETNNDNYIRHGDQAAIRTFIGAGSGNGLDADLLDGQQGSYYQADTANLFKYRGTINTQDWNTFVDGTEAGFWGVSNMSGSNAPPTYTYGIALSASVNTQGKFQLYAPHNGSEGGNGLYYRSGWNTDYDAWAEIWHSNNDGSGSGLDADLLDGNQASAFKTNSTTDSNNVYIRNSSPTVFFRDTDHNSAMIHANGNLLYILRGGNDSVSWSQVNGQWPWYWNLANNDAVGGGNLTLNGGNIILNGTGRIQGIDTVSAGTDAANKTYVDNAVASGVTTGKAIAMAIVFG